VSATRILGIGSPSGDDQAGWLTVDALLAAGLDELDVEKLDRPGASLIPMLENTSRVILIDAMQGNGPVGEIQHFDQKDWPGYCHGLSSHGFGVLAALMLARELGSLPPRLDLYGIGIGSVLPGAEAGHEVQAAAQRLAAIIVSSLKDEAGLRAVL
jgi:hydrogenase maturation protease